MSDTFRKNFRPLTDEENQLIDDVKETAEKLESLLGRIESPGTAGEAINIAKTKLQEAVFWAVHGISA